MMKVYNLRQPSEGLVFNSDRGPQQKSERYSNSLATCGVRASIGDVGTML